MEIVIPIRPMIASDVDAVLAIQAESPGAAQWNRAAYDEISAGSGLNRCLIADRNQTPVGFATFRVVAPEAELLNLAVLPAFRRMGIGARLLEEVIRKAVASGASDLFLEARDSNLSALGLYRRFSFELHHRRPGYYSDPPADALTLHLRLPP